jgi:hypothetical protein
MKQTIDPSFTARGIDLPQTTAAVMPGLRTAREIGERQQHASH